MFEKLISNDLELSKGYYAAIIGLNSSKGVRSPALWNAVFMKKNLPVEYVNFDVPSEENLSQLIPQLEKDPKFIGGSVTIPYKEKIVPHLSELHFSAQCGAVNCIYRSQKGKLGGMNTDGLGAIQSLKCHNDFVTLNVKNRQSHVLLWGAGGVAKAIAISLLTDSELSIHQLMVALRSEPKRLSWQAIQEQTFAKNKLETDVTQNILRYSDKYDLIIQCTPVGSSSSNLSHISPFENEACLERISSPISVFFDVNYSPAESLARQHWRNIRTTEPLNGLAMNRLQAVIALKHVMDSVQWLNHEPLSRDEISHIMSQY